MHVRAGLPLFLLVLISNNGRTDISTPPPTALPFFFFRTCPDFAEGVGVVYVRLGGRRGEATGFDRKQRHYAYHQLRGTAVPQLPRICESCGLLGFMIQRPPVAVDESCRAVLLSLSGPLIRRVFC